MPDINSPLGRRALATSGSRVLTVPNEETSISNFSASEDNESERNIEAIQTLRKNKLIAARKITPIAKERIEILTGLGRCYETVEFEGVSFSIRSLKSGEMREVVRLSNTAADPADAFFEARTQTLARSIYEIDGQPIALVLGSNGLEDVVSWLEEMHEPFIDFIHDHYKKMIKTNSSKFNIKDEKDSKEVAEEIKK